MVKDDTKNCDDVRNLESTYPMLENSTFVDVAQKRMAKYQKQYQERKNKNFKSYRRISNEIDNNDNPYKSIVSVLMLKEGLGCEKCNNYCWVETLYFQETFCLSKHSVLEKNVILEGCQ